MKEFPESDSAFPKETIDDRFRLGDATHAILLHRRHIYDYNEALERLGVSREELEDIIAKLRQEIPS
jgi:hypothetical protein